MCELLKGQQVMRQCAIIIAGCQLEVWEHRLVTGMAQECQW